MSHLFGSWESLYANHAALRTVIAFAHIAGLISGGGAAIVADRAALSARRGHVDRIAVLSGIRGTHRVVLAGLAVVMVSGALLLAADSETYLHSWVFWLKMGLLALLLANGVLVMRAERHAVAGAPSAWRMLTWTAWASLALWALTTLAGAALPNVG